PYQLRCTTDRDPPDPPSFPTRRSSDLNTAKGKGGENAALSVWFRQDRSEVHATHSAHAAGHGRSRRVLLRRLGDHGLGGHQQAGDRKSTRLNSSHVKISYAVFCLKKTN